MKQWTFDDTAAVDAELLRLREYAWTFRRYDASLQHNTPIDRDIYAETVAALGYDPLHVETGQP
jgi:hypothetical protein